MSRLQPSRRTAMAFCVAVAAVAAWAHATPFASACDTPVYRYAMYRWEPAPYQVYYFHDKPLDAQATKIQETIEAAETSEQKPANLIFIPVDLTKDTELKTVPPYVKKDWEALEEPKLPSYMVVGPPPYFIKMFVGDLDQTAVAALIDSPVRRKIAKQLERGKASVLVMLGGSDQKANAEAEKSAKSLIEDIAAGKVEVYLPPPVYMEDESSEQSKPSIEFGFAKLTRDDPKERWLVESLLCMEEDLKEEKWADKPMIFPVFGRGRALPPFVGEGINRDNLLACVDFVTGACSCTVKDQNPGMDLLIAYDWYTAAENLAKTFGADEGAEYQFATEDFFPDLVIPADQQGNTPSATADDAQPEKAGEGADAQPEQTVAVASTGAEQPAVDQASDDGEAQVDEPGPTVAQPPEAGQRADGADATEPETATAAEATEDAAATEPRAKAPLASAAQPNADRSEDSQTFIGVYAVGTGVGVALLVLFALTFLVLRPR